MAQQTEYTTDIKQTSPSTERLSSPEIVDTKVVTQKVCKAECLFELQKYLFFSLCFP
ncbi:unknown [Porphyromonas sp. CAG:1061]|nr:unknown [Porphyromonas sp. CAG:1061]